MSVTNDFTRLNRLYLAALQKLATEDIAAARVTTGLEMEFLEMIRQMSVVDLDDVASMLGPTFIFRPRFHAKDWRRFLHEKQDDPNSLLVLGAITREMDRSLSGN